ncbi:eukaryotic translation initiation factor 4E binding protein-domain-containing protein [Gaertneriomyces semiglobifer]|nr:eukaryotic translation initiation factor 4E binding protein-domain-containing protein [Gaertneriomyces semiglobifer]
MSSEKFLKPNSTAPIAVRRAPPGSKPPHNYGTTPGGTIFGTTPGGTRIIYSKDALLNLSRSPLSQTPPKGLAYVPGITNVKKPEHQESKKDDVPKKDEKPKDDLFDMEI